MSDVSLSITPCNEKNICREISTLYDTLEWREYGNQKPRRGRAVIANFMEFKWEAKTRYGSNKDVSRLKSSLGSHKFDIDEWNLKGVDADPFMQMVKKEAANEDHSRGDCFVMVIMTHGGIEGHLLAHENTFKLDDVVECFTGDKCRGLLLKPKIFIVQACRGTCGHLAVAVSKTKKTSPVPLNVITRPTHSDIVIAQAQYEGFYSLRDTENGSYFIQAFCDVLDKDFDKPNHLKDDFLHLLTFTAHMVACYEFWEIKKSKNQSDGSTDEASGEKKEEKEQKLDFQDSLHDSEPVKALEIDARPFNTKHTISTKLIKQQPTVVSTLLKLFYLRKKNVEENKKECN